MLKLNKQGTSCVVLNCVEESYAKPIARAIKTHTLRALDVFSKGSLVVVTGHLYPYDHLGLYGYVNDVASDYIKGCTSCLFSYDSYHNWNVLCNEFDKDKLIAEVRNKKLDAKFDDFILSIRAYR